MRQYVKESYLNCKMAPFPSNCDTNGYASFFVIPYVYAFPFYSHHSKNSFIALTVRSFPFWFKFQIDLLTLYFQNGSYILPIIQCTFGKLFSTLKLNYGQREY